MMDMGQYLEIFIEESKENLQNMNQSLLDLENNYGDKSILNDIFRVAHTLKGMSSTMGFSKVASLTHEMENVLQALRNNEIPTSEKIIDLLFECLDILEEYINEISNTGDEGDLESNHLIKKLNNVMSTNIELSITESSDEEIPAISSEILIEAEEFSKSIVEKAALEGYNGYRIKIELNPNCMLKSARAFIIFNTIERDCEILKSNPPVEDIEDEKFDTSFELIILTRMAQEELKRELCGISEVENVLIEKIILKEYSTRTDQQEVENKLSLEIEESMDEDEDKRQSKTKKPKVGKTVRVDIDRLDNLMNLVSELIIIKTRLEDIDDDGRKQNMNEAIEYLERITTSLHDAVMKVRMVPIERVFNRFPRMIRDLSKELGKEISLFMSGEETEVDRTVIDEIGDPLIHLIRNSIDHGIEDPETRKRFGKPDAGTVKLIAYPDGNSVVIEVEDDGQGINIDRVKAKALEKGIITKEQSDTMDEKEAIHLLFHAGFSTADKISDISGRGVGLDVVKTKIESLGGIVEVQTIKNKGSKFIIRLPLTLAIIQALLVNIGTEKYAIPLNSIKEIITIKTASIRKVQNQEVVLYRNHTLPILRMNKILHVDREEPAKEDLTVVVVKKGDKTAGFVVDSLIGQQEIVIKSLGKFLSGIKVIAGATILGNGQVALIVDTNSLF
ncbi:two-component system, chemotaxis family, sensor kinase CheA [Geosporobacter subterraneus DSM 17957]|uniref:Chemotaxis protein CheA n=1 Tax=Geosporobacter subterraneus DSM 17957 TaxID=1121919 RepID=A0A1M6E2U5_9FIRM|nr:chemotaxis protein CheA [Geosporobacter subterraneus]SHI79709.1 two-component system, chemotaxis family, sensor kinase CheA [Geosporobacter subterraneus DSM 17957]